MELICNRETLFSTSLSRSEKCLHLSKACASSQETLNIFKLFLCPLNGQTLIFLPLFLLCLLLLFKFICATVEEYIAPAILYLSKYLKLSDALAGVTLLAFANGAGDVITAIVASDSKEGISYNVGALYGAGFFVVTLVLALTVSYSPVEVVVGSSVLWRDCGFYVLASVMTIFFGLQGEITFVSSLMMLGLYLVYVLVVVVEDYFKGKKEKGNDRDCEVVREGVKESLIELKNKFTHKDEEKNNKKKEKKTVQENLLKIIATKRIARKMHNFLKLKLAQKKSQENSLSSKLEKLITLLDTPFHILRSLTIPPCSPCSYNHSLTTNWPYLGVLFIFWTLSSPSLLWLLIIPLSLLTYYYLKTHPSKSSSEIPSYFIYINLLGILCGILWTKICCGILVDLLTVFGVMTGLSSTYLGLTIIAVGNALPDGLATISIAKQGQAVMGITGGIAGQLFGLLAGFGVSMMKKSLKEDRALRFDLFVWERIGENLLDLLVVFVVFGTLVFIICYGYWNLFVFDKRLGSILLGVYSGFIGVATVIAFYQAFTG